MERLDHVIRVLGELAAEAGIDGFHFNDAYRASLALDGIRVTFAYSAEPAELLWLYVDLGAVPEGPEASNWLLEVGFATWAASVMTIALDDSGRRAMGYTAIAVTMLDLTALKDMLAQLLQAAKPIRGQLAARAFDLDTQTSGREIPDYSTRV
ncbi:MAG: type III secretion system chaperone [Pseudomonadota bacterium]